MYPYGKPPKSVETSSLLGEAFWDKLKETFADPGITFSDTALRYDDKDHYRLLITYSCDLPSNILDEYSIAMDDTLNELQGDHDYRVFFEEGFLQVVVTYVN